MLPETLQVYQKYRYFLHVLSDERIMLFQKSEHEFNYEEFFELYNWIIYMHWTLKPIYRNFKTRRSQIIKKFNYEKYYILLKPYFCHDLVTVIITFIL